MFDDQSFEKPRLILKYFRGELTPEEAEELNKWLQEDKRNRLLMDSLLNELEIQQESRFYSSVNLEEGWEQVLGKLGQKKKRGLLKRTLPALPAGQAGGRQVARWQVAATLAGILIAAWGVYQWAGKDRLPEGVSEAATVNDIAPGEDKARLTLADGSEVILDGAEEALISEEDGIRISRREGELEYQLAVGSEQLAAAYHTLSTPRGGQYRLVLPDGSKVWLNAASSIRFPMYFAGDERKVELKGEAYFEIARDARRPFRVEVADQAEVEVLGTHFNIMAYEEESNIQTTVLEGSVMVTTESRVIRNHLAYRQAGKPKTTLPALPTGQAGGRQENKKLLNPGQQARINKATASLEVTEVNTSEVVAWKDGLFHFSDDDIQSVMKQIARWYNVEVHYEGELPDTEFTGMISRKVNISQVLNMLERTGGVKFRVEERNITVKK